MHKWSSDAGRNEMRRGSWREGVGCGGPQNALTIPFRLELARIVATMPSAATDVEIREFRERLLGAFPPSPFHGLVSTHDECDDGIHLRRELPGKRWDDLSPEVLFHGSIALRLLEPHALVSFLPAWLLRSRETLGKGSIVLEFTLYFLCPGNEEDGWDERGISELTALFDRAQKGVIEALLRAVVAEDTLEFWHPYANFGLTWWSVIETSGGPDRSRCI
jgi:hypothetical protein